MVNTFFPSIINSNSLLRIFKATPLPMLVLLPDAPHFTIVDANVAFLEMKILIEQDIRNKSIFEVFHERNQHKNVVEISDLCRSLKAVVSSRMADKMSVQKFEIEVENNQSGKFYFESENIPILDEAGEVEYIVHTLVDVTKRESFARQLRSTEKKLLATQQIAKIGYWKLDIPKEKLFWSEEVYIILGVNKDDFKLSYELFFQTIHSEDKEAFTKARSAALAGEKEMDFEFRVIQPNGVQKWIHEIGKVVKNEKEQPVSFEGTVQDITESKLLKLSLEESVQRYHYVTKATFDAIYDWNLITDECYWGSGFQKSFGYDLETLLSDKSFWEKHVHSGDHERVVNEINKAVNGTTKNWLNEYRFEKADGNYASVLDRSFLIRDKKGTAVRMVGAIQDITEKKNLQELLDKTNRLARIGSWEIDVENDTVFWSDLTKEIRETGMDFLPTLQEGITYFKEGYSKDTIIKKVKESVKNGTSWQEDLQIYTHKGKLKWIRTIGKAEIVDGKCRKIYGSFQDIDESKKAELEILKLYEEKNVILESIGDAFFTVDKNWTVGYWNKEAENMLMTLKNKIIGKNLWDVFSESIGSVSYERYHESIETNKRVVFEDFYPALERWFEISVYPSENGLSVYFKDITERKFSQIQLNELHQNLQKTARDLVVSNAGLEQFAYVASHDLQEPLRMVTGFLSQLEKKYSDSIDAKGKQYIYFAVDGAKRMRQIILDLLQFSRVGRFEGKAEDVNTNKVVKEIFSLYKKKIEKTKAIIQFDKLPIVHTFKSPLTQVIQNLISNAMKYHNAGRPLVIKINAEKMDTHWQFSVQDNGIGIDADSYERIFIIFQRLHSKDEYSGTGIGLAIVKKIVEGMGGQIWLKSRKGEGSTFFFTIKH
ncbi:MAG: PAS domain-containing protein [Ginsengibacter sp.]